MTRSLLAAVFVLVASSVTAQTVERTIDLSAFGWGAITARPVETDGNPLTEEWLVQEVGTARLRVVAVRECGLAVGDWFAASSAPVAMVTIHRFGHVDKLLLAEWAGFSPTGTLHVVSLETPHCGETH